MTLTTKAGHPILHRKPSEIIESTIVLCQIPNKLHPYVTWSMDAKGNTYSGHYSETLDDAHDDYNKRNN